MRRQLLLLVTAAVAASGQQIEGQLEKFTSGYDFVSALAWSTKENALFIADGPAGIVRRVDQKGTTKWREGLHVSSLAVDDKAAIYATDARERRVIRMGAKGPEVLASAFEGKRLNGPADIAVAKNGTVWFTDPAFATADGAKELPFYGVYRVPPKGEPTAVARLTSRPNGLAISPDGKTLYVSVADDRTVIAWTIGKEGQTTDQRVFARGIDGVPDGLTVTPDGRVWVCAREIEVYSADGKKLSTIEVPEKPSDLEFGESGGALFIAAGTSVYRWTSKEGAPHRQPQVP